MELKDFVKETVAQIVQGVVEAQALIKMHGAEINPKRVQFKEAGQFNSHNSGKPQYVEFDVGLTSTQKAGSSEGIGVFLGSVNLGKKNDGSTEQTAVSRIKFSLPLVLPSGTGDHIE